MRSLSASQLLGVWERGQVQPPIERALLLLATACPDRTRTSLADLPLGRRDRLLLELRARIFGARIESLASCPRCGERVEVALDTAELLTAAPAADGPARWRGGDLEAELRLPTTSDLAAVVDLGGEEAGPALLARCAVRITRRGKAVEPEELDEDRREQLSEALRAADPPARIDLALACPECGRRWSALFDVVSFLWLEIEAWADRTLRDVLALARAYGWREADILAMSAWRRQRYLSLAGE